MGGTEKSNRILGCSLLFLCIAWIWVFAAMPTKASDNEKVCGYTYTYTSKEALEQEIANKRNEGLLYAGLYKESISEDNIITKDELSLKTNAIKEPQANTTYVIKFVPEGVLGITAQVSGALIADENLDASAIRFVTAVDSLVYDKVAFSVTRMKEGQAHEMVKDENVTNLVYSKLYAVDATTASEDNLIEYYPADMHSEALFFKTYKLTGVPSSAYNEDFTVTPYWVTYDGIRVEGTSSIKTMNLGRSWYYVDETATNENALGTYNDPFMTIQKAAEHETELVPKLILKNDMAAAAQITLSKALTISSGDSEKTIAISRSNNFTDEIFKITNGEVKFENVVVGDASQESTVDALVAKKGKLSLSNGVINGTVNIDLQEISLQNTVVGNAIALADRDKYVAINDTDKKLMFGEDGIVVVASDAHVHCPCGDVARVEGACYESEHYEVLFEALTDADESKLSGKNRYLTEDVTWDAARETVGQNQTINLCLNGHNLTKQRTDEAKDRFIQMDGSNSTMNVCGRCEKSDGNVKGSIIGISATGKGYAGLFWVGNTNTARKNINLNLYNMKLDVYDWNMEARPAGAGAGVIVFAGCSLNTYDSEIVPAKTIGTGNYATAYMANRSVFMLEGATWNNPEGLAGRVENGEVHDLTNSAIGDTVSSTTIPVAARAYHTTTGNDNMKLMFASNGVKVVSADAHVHCPCGNEHAVEGPCYDAQHYEVEFTALTEADEGKLKGKNLYLTEDVTWSGTREGMSNGEHNVNLCLNGYTLTKQGNERIVQYNTNATGTMNVSGKCEHSETGNNGTIKGISEANKGYPGLLWIQGGANLNLYSMQLDVSEWNMFGRAGGAGAGVLVFSGCSLNTYNSEIVPAKTIGAENYATANMANRSVFMLEGATWNNPEGLAGAVENGEVHDLSNKAIGTKINTNNKTIPTDIQPYHKVVNGENKELLFLANEIRVGGIFDLEGAEEGTTVYDKTISVTGRQYCSTINNDNDQWKLMFAKNAVKVVPKDAHVHCVCGDESRTEGPCYTAGHCEVKYDALTTADQGNMKGKNLYLTDNVAWSNDKEGMNAGNNVNLCLNGYTLTKPETSRLVQYNATSTGTMNVAGKCEHSGTRNNGSIKGISTTNKGEVGLLWIQGKSTLNLYDMTLDVYLWSMAKRDQTTGNGAGITLFTGASLSTYGSTIIPAKDFGLNSTDVLKAKSNRGVYINDGGTWNNPEGLQGRVETGAEYYKADDYLANASLFVPVWSSTRTTPVAMLDFEEKWDSFFTPNGRLMSMAHRGDNNEYYPENSLEGIMSCIQAGVDMIEIDMRKTADGEIVLMHDETLTRTTNVSEVRAAGILTLPESDNVSDWTLDQLRELRLCKVSGTSKIPTDYAIPTLKDAIKVSAGKVFIFLDRRDNTIDWDNVYTLLKDNEALRSWLPWNYQGTMDVTTLINTIKTDAGLDKVAYQSRVSDLNAVADIVQNIETNDLPKVLRVDGEYQDATYVSACDAALAQYKGQYRIHMNVFYGDYNKPSAWKLLYEDKGYNILHVNRYLELVQCIEETCFTESIPTE